MSARRRSPIARRSRSKTEIDYTHKKQTGGTGPVRPRQVHRVSPNEAGKGFEFESKIVGGSVPKEYIPGVEKGLESVMNSGPLAGFPVVDVKVELIDGAYHDVDSSALAFEIASRAAFREALQKGATSRMKSEGVGLSAGEVMLAGRSYRTRCRFTTGATAILVILSESEGPHILRVVTPT